MEASWEIFQHLHMIIAQVNKLTTASWETLSQKHPAKLCTFEWKFFRTNASLVLVVQSLSRVQLLATPWTAAGQASLSFTISWSLLKLMSTESMMPSNHLILCPSLLVLPSIFPSSSLFQWVSFSCRVAKVLELQLQNQSFQWIFRVDFLQDWLVWSPCYPRDSQESFPAPQFERINSSAPFLLSICQEVEGLGLS